MALDATVGGANANSYLTVAEADAYFATRYGVTAWKTVASNMKEALLMEATRMLDRLVDWNGYLWTQISGGTSQALRWPRYYAYDQDYRLIPSDVIPQGVKDLVCEAALYILTNGTYDASQNPLESLKLGTITMKFKDNVVSGGFPQNVIDMIKAWGYYTAPRPGSIGLARLERV